MPIGALRPCYRVMYSVSKDISPLSQPAPLLKRNICRDLLQRCTYFVRRKYLVFWVLYSYLFCLIFDFAIAWWSEKRPYSFRNAPLPDFIVSDEGLVGFEVVVALFVLNRVSLR